jgi:hypothetical protein
MQVSDILQFLLPSKDNPTAQQTTVQVTWSSQ